ncbi:MAG: diphthine--ammonia ligase [Paramarteilia canceri]
MKVCCLISGGKDSMFNAWKCIENGHQIACFVNLQPPTSEDLNSYMYQTVGHEVIDLIAQSCGVKLFKKVIKNKPKDLTIDYSEECDDDEVEDLYDLLKEAREVCYFDALGTGALHSSYQFNRVKKM